MRELTKGATSGKGALQHIMRCAVRGRQTEALQSDASLYHGAALAPAHGQVPHSECGRS